MVMIKLLQGACNFSYFSYFIYLFPFNLTISTWKENWKMLRWTVQSNISHIMLLNIIPFFYTVLTYLQISIIENLKIENFWECFPGLKKCNKIDLEWSFCIVSTTSVFKILLFVYISISTIIFSINSWLMKWF